MNGTLATIPGSEPPFARPGLPRLLAGLESFDRVITAVDHERIHGPLHPCTGPELIAMIERSGLRGRGGADFPTARKLQAVREMGRGRGGASAVVVNGSETEPASAKDRLLLSRLPHLVLDGALLAADAVDAREVIVKVGERASDTLQALQSAIAMRTAERIPVSVVIGPEGYVGGEESAVVRFLNDGKQLPTLVPPRPYERGYRGRPTLINNPETLAQLALIARFGDSWFRELGTNADPGSVLVTISGAVMHPDVYEIEFGTRMTDLLAAAGGATEPLQALLVGGYFGTWVDYSRAANLCLARSDLRSIGASLGSGVVIALGEDGCGLHESARVIDYLARQSAGQCGPCVHGLAAISEAFAALVNGVALPQQRRALERWLVEVRGRGACHHPDGVSRFAQSALQVFEADLERHYRGECRGSRRRPALGMASPGMASPGMASPGMASGRGGRGTASGRGGPGTASGRGGGAGPR